MLYIPIAILMFGLLIALHEFGHFAAAKLCGVRVNEFSIGMGPLLFHRQVGETDYSLRALPIGGFCAMEGEQEGESRDPRAFPNRPWRQRLIVLLAGVFMNFLTGLVIILCFTAAQKGFYTPVVNGFQQGMTAQEQGVAIGDRIVKIDGHRVYTAGDISLLLSRSEGGRVKLELRRDGKKVVIPNYQFGALVDAESGQFLRPILGIETTVKPRTAGLVLQNTWNQAMDYVRLVWLSLGDLVTGQVGLRDISGVIGVVDMVGELGESGAQAAQAVGLSPLWGAMNNILQFTAFLAINLAVMNLLPIPALDGGQIFFLAVNGVLIALRGKPLDPKYQGWVTAAGFACLMVLMLAVTVSDILKQFGV